MHYKSLYLLLAIATSQTESWGGEVDGPKSIITTRMNALGFAGWNGELNAWWDVGVVEVSPELKIPIRLNFNSTQSKIGNSILGWNWWMPLMESNVVKKNETQLFLNLPGGRSTGLWKTGKNSSVFRSADQQWEGQVDQRGNFRATNIKEGLVLEFFKGRLASMKLETGKTLTWTNNAEGKPLKIEDDEGNQLLHLVYDERGFPQTIEYRGHNGQFQVIETKINNIVLGPNQIYPALSKLDSSDNSTKSFEYTCPDVKSVAMTTSNETTGEDIQTQKYVWDVSDGFLQAAEGVKYNTSIAKDGFEFYSKTLPDGKNENYHFNPQTGVSHLVKGGKAIERTYFTDPGMRFGKSRKLVVKDLKGNDLVTSNTYYDSDGKIIRKIRNGKETVYIEDSNKIVELLENKNLRVIYLTKNSETIEFYRGNAVAKDRSGNDTYLFDYNINKNQINFGKLYSCVNLEEIENSDISIKTIIELLEIK